MGFAVLTAALYPEGAAATPPLAKIREFSAGLQAHSNLHGITRGADGNMWFTDSGGSSPAIGRITPAGHITLFTAGLKADSSPDAIANGPDGSVWFTDVGATGGTPAIGRITPAGQITEFTAGLNGTAFPDGIAVGFDGNMWFTDDACSVGLHPNAVPNSTGPASTCAIGRITPSGQITEFTTGLNSGSFPDAIAPGPDGAVWFTDIGCWPFNNTFRPPAASCAIGRITPSGQITEFATTGLPDAIALGPDGNLWFTDGGTPAIGRITPSGQITKYTAGLTTTPGAIVRYPGIVPPGPSPIAAGPDGNVWFTPGRCASHCSIGRVTTNGQITELSAGLNPGSWPTAIAAGPDDTLWFVDQGRTPAIGRIGAGAPIGKVELVNCKAETLRRAKFTCTTTLVTSSDKLVAAGAIANAALSRGGVVYARGYARNTRAGVEVLLVALHTLARGPYRLALTGRPGRSITTIEKVTIG